MTDRCSTLKHPCMNFLDFPTDSPTSHEKSKNPTDKLLNPPKRFTASPPSTSISTAERILNRVPPKIEAMKSSEVLSRVAAFLPQLAASNQKILQKRPEDVNIEILNGQEREIIEMKLGLGVFEEKRQSENDSENGSENDSENENENESDHDLDLDLDQHLNQTTTTFTDKRKKERRKILVLPSELRAAALKEKDEMDPFEKVINSLLLFDGSTDDEETEEETEEKEKEIEIEEHVSSSDENMG